MFHRTIPAADPRAKSWPTATLAVLFLAGLILAPWPQHLFALLVSERGVAEVATVFVALAGAALALRLAFARLPHAALRAYFSVFAVGLVFLAGEEASWGQHWIGFETPEGHSNLQGETNLHNTSLAAERIPKTVLSLAIFFGGIVWPIYAAVKRRPPVLSGWFGWIWPDARLWPAAAIAFGLRLYERTCVWIDVEDGPFRPYYMYGKESIELFYVLFILLYLMAIGRRIVMERRRAVDDHAALHPAE